MKTVIGMTLQEIMRDKNLTKYRLSKESGIPWATLSDICSGKTRLDRCSAGTLMKLSTALGIPMEHLLTMTIEPSAGKDGKPLAPSYLEADLPEDLKKAIADYLRGESVHSSVLDCLWDELYGSINANLWGGRITEEQAHHLRTKYLYEEEQEDGADD